jgi:hypothetical protein
MQKQTQRKRPKAKDLLALQKVGAEAGAKVGMLTGGLIAFAVSHEVAELLVVGAFLLAIGHVVGSALGRGIGTMAAYKQAAREATATDARKTGDAQRPSHQKGPATEAPEQK